MSYILFWILVVIPIGSIVNSLAIFVSVKILKLAFDKEDAK